MLNVAIIGSVKSASRFPAGLIVPSTAATTPDGTAAFSSADNRVIIGAGDTYSVGATGGTAFGGVVGTMGGNTGTSGAHTDSANIQTFGSGSATSPQAKSSASAGDHYHPLGNIIISEIDRNQLKLVKLTQNMPSLPPNTGVFSASSLSNFGLSNTYTNNKYFSAGSSVSEKTASGTVALGTAGLHIHTSDSGNGPYGGSTVDFEESISAGEHSSTESLTSISLALEHLKLSLWQHATQRINCAKSMIAMWESTTPPVGWELLEAAQDCFIQSVASGSENTVAAGNNQGTFGISGSITHSGTHTHRRTTTYSNSTTSYSMVYHADYAWSHSHTVSASNVLSYLPPYYALVFIRKR